MISIRLCQTRSDRSATKALALMFRGTSREVEVVEGVRRMMLFNQAADRKSAPNPCAKGGDEGEQAAGKFDCGASCLSRCAPECDRFAACALVNEAGRRIIGHNHAKHGDQPLRAHRRIRENMRAGLFILKSTRQRAGDAIMRRAIINALRQGRTHFRLGSVFGLLFGINAHWFLAAFNHILVDHNLINAVKTRQIEH